MSNQTTWKDRLPKGVRDKLTAAGRHAARVKKHLVPYKHELTAIAKQLGCEDKPFQCFIKIQQLKGKAEAFKDVSCEVGALKMAIREKDARLEQATACLDAADAATTAHDAAENEAHVMWRALGFENRTPPEGSDLLVWLMMELETAQARLETEKASARAFQLAASDLLSTIKTLQARLIELEDRVQRKDGHEQSIAAVAC